MKIRKLFIRTFTLGVIFCLGCTEEAMQFEVEPPSTDSDTTGKSPDATETELIDDSSQTGDTSPDNPSTESHASATDADSESDSDSSEPSDNEPAYPWLDKELGIGSSCNCTGDCDIVGSPVPTRGQEQGCSNVPADDFPNAKLACLRSFAGNGMSPKPYYYANGYCTLYASKCVPILDPINLLCPNTTVGNYDKFSRCPQGTALISSVLRLEGGPSGTLIKGDVYFKICAPLCETDEDCRIGETDDIFRGAESEYQCLDKDGVKFCLDPRALNNPPHDPNDYTAEAFL